MSKAIVSGKLLENLVFNELSKLNSNVYKITPQYKYKDVFKANARIDFLVESQFKTQINKSYFIECKNHNVCGSLDQKFPYYIENIRNNLYGDSPLILVLNTKGIRPLVMDYLVNNTYNYNYKVVDLYNLYKLSNIVENDCYKKIFLKNDYYKRINREI
jgi:hypothetical protein